MLRRHIGSAKVMHDQPVHLAELAERPMIKVHVIPAEVGAHIGLLGAFAIAGFADDAPGIVYFESPDEGGDDEGLRHAGQNHPDVRYVEIRSASARSFTGLDHESS